MWSVCFASRITYRCCVNHVTRPRLTQIVRQSEMKNITARDVYNILKPEFVEEIIKAEMLEIMEIAEDKKLRKAARLIYNYHSLWADQI